jgi:hypothetical protein
MQTALRTQRTGAPPPSFTPVRGSLLQRKCACGGAPGPTGECESCRQKKLQRKLTVGASNDPLEQEADRVADEVLAARAHSAVSGAPPRIQRGNANAPASTAPASVDRVLGSPGRPLAPVLRQDMEQRFGHDFSRVRIHTDGAADQSARDVNAHAYTVGRDVVFDGGRFRPHSLEGRRLLAHELTHVLQQDQGPPQVQRWAECKTTGMALDGAEPEDCLAREPGEKQRARTGPMVVVQISVPLSSEKGVLIANFDISKATIKSSLHRTIEWREYLSRITSNRSRLKILGFTDCHLLRGGSNEALRKERAAAVFNVLPRSVQSNVSAYEQAPINECVTENISASDRALNRSAVLIIEYSEVDMEAEEVAPSQSGKEPPSQNCSKEQRNRLALAFPVAEKMIRNALRVINDMQKGSDEERLLMKYFGKDAFSHATHIREGFAETLRQWQKAGPTYPYVCVKQGDGECTGRTLGYVEPFGLPEFVPGIGGAWFPRGDIHICEKAFAFTNNLYLAAALLHETSHMVGWAFGDVYCDMETNGGCPSLSTKEAEGNADSYAQFAREAFEQGG